MLELPRIMSIGVESSANCPEIAIIIYSQMYQELLLEGMWLLRLSLSGTAADVGEKEGAPAATCVVFFVHFTLWKDQK